MSRCLPGILSIDAMVPVGRGQRELIVGIVKQGDLHTTWSEGITNTPNIRSIHPTWNQPPLRVLSADLGKDTK